MPVLGPHPPRLPIGYSDYVQLRAAGFSYVDKTAFIAQVLDDGAVTQLHPRPRRFGKTLNLSTLRHFIERGGALGAAELFEDTWIWQAEGGRYRAHFQRYPVVYLTFKDIKFNTWGSAWGGIRLALQAELHRLWQHHGLAERLGGDPAVQASYAALQREDAPPERWARLLPTLAQWCHAATGEPLVILIDEYDAPLLTAWQHGYWDEAVGFFRAFLSAGLKDDPRVFRGVLTGILRVAKEGIFSGLNNVGTFGLLNAGPAATCFGFTEAEVEALVLAQDHIQDHTAALADIARWYNGYRFGGAAPHTLYNPWSVLQYLANPVDGFRSYWKNSSANELIHSLLLRHAGELGFQFQRLLEGECVTARVDEDVPLTRIHDNAEALWSLLLFSGYLTAEAVTPDEHGLTCRLRIPNREVSGVYRTSFLAPLERRADSVPQLVAALLKGDAETAGLILEDLLLDMLSHHDLGARPVEAVYQAFVVGLLVSIRGSHRVVSNREAGFGRADVLLIPHQPGPGAVLELKVVHRRQTPEAALAAAVDQLTARRYHAEVQAQGATAVHQYAVVFDGKRCWVQVVPA